MAAASSPGAHYPLRGLEHKGKNIKKSITTLMLTVICFFLFFTLMSCRRPDMWICFIGKSQDLPEKQIRIAARGEERDSKTLSFFIVFVLFVGLTKFKIVMKGELYWFPRTVIIKVQPQSIICPIGVENYFSCLPSEKALPTVLPS